jgi:hypothetical protein
MLTVSDEPVAEPEPEPEVVAEAETALALAPEATKEQLSETMKAQLHEEMDTLRAELAASAAAASEAEAERRRLETAAAEKQQAETQAEWERREVGAVDHWPLATSGAFPVPRFVASGCSVRYLMLHPQHTLQRLRGEGRGRVLLILVCGTALDPNLQPQPSALTVNPPFNSNRTHNAKHHTPNT